MKTLKIFLVSICLLFSCSKKDNATSRNPSILGRWSLLPSLYEAYANGTIVSTITQLYEASDYIEFMSNGTMQTKAFGSINSNQYRIQNDSIFIDNVSKGKIKTLLPPLWSITL